MGLTPTKQRSKTAEAPTAITDYKHVDQLRRAWIAQLPDGYDADVAATPALAAALDWNVAGCARQVMEWTHFQPHLWTAPTWYRERLARICTWLQAQPKTDLPNRREDALQILLAAWPPFLAFQQHPELTYDTIPSLYTPEDVGEFGPLDMPLPYLPHWTVRFTPEQVDALEPEHGEERREAARISEEFTLYAGLVTWLNTQIGLDVLDLEPNPF